MIPISHPDTLPSIGVGVPVKNGSNYVTAALNSLMSSSNPHLKVLVSVDGDPNLVAYLKSVFPDERFTFAEAPESLSMAGHYEYLITKFTSDWVTILGQDDAITSRFDVVTSKAIMVADSKGIKAISFRRAYFNWQDGTSRSAGYVSKYADFGKPKDLKSLTALRHARAGFIPHFDLPQVYTNNLVHRSTLEALRSQLQPITILEPIPDTFLGVAIAMQLPSYLKWPTPAFWTGTSQSSVGPRENNHEWKTNSRAIPEHITLAIEEGRNFGVGLVLWEKSQSSPTMVFSALNAYSRKMGHSLPRILSIVNVAATLSESGIRFIIRRREPLPSGLVADMFELCPRFYQRVAASLLVPYFLVAQTLWVTGRSILFRSGVRRSGFCIKEPVSDEVTFERLDELIPEKSE